MASTQQVIALCSVGNLGKSLCDELLEDGRYKFFVISRQSSRSAFFKHRNIEVKTSDYSLDSVLKILNETNTTVLISFNNSHGQTFVDVHCAFLEACRKSSSCKRFIPSEFAGNIDEFPHYPSYYVQSRVPFRTVLEKEQEVEWTIFNNGWLMDYCLTADKSYMPAIPNEFPIDPNGWKACIRGSGDQLQSFTSCRDVAKALIMLLEAPQWEPTTYITGQWSTFNEMVRRMEKFHGRRMNKTYRSEEDIRLDTLLPPTAENSEKRYLASVEEMMLTAAGACPYEKTMRQREKFFPGLEFTWLEKLLSEAKPLEDNVLET
ncbi:hypothetical protein L249_3158 [Ophiocordyceps polyrhachis-furcata BCC 54312]|uniref:Uncharacterized protein n=1 Tax=Ophiocordyceps polyrhachis-furcata BCC 54312 TaxID=1330021 RepID=A0A367LS41_9HYPO|nr:hypothetical protein L249_3158 [Ophiocordyceps polyrhachis-furcata BCC 54312]